MTNPIEVLVPDIGGFKDVSVIDVLVKDGQQIDKETPLITIETEKAAMDVPAPFAGRIAQVKLKQGDKVSEGSLILLVEPAAAARRQRRQPAAASRRTRVRASAAHLPRPPRRRAAAAAPAPRRRAAPLHRRRGRADAAAATDRAAMSAAAAPTAAARCRSRSTKRLFKGLRQSFRPQVRARIGRGSRADHRHRLQGPHHAG